MRALLLGLALMATSGCGFQLLGAGNWPEGWRQYQLDYPARDPQARQLATLADETLRQRRLEPAAGEEGFRVDITGVADRKLVAAIGADGKAVEFELRRELRFVVSGAEFRPEAFTVSAGRRYSFDPSVLLAKEAEERRLQTELSREIVELMLLRIEAQLRRWDASGQLDQNL